MARRVLIKCEQCGKEAIVAEKLDKVTMERATEHMPSGWRTVTLNLSRFAEAEVCSFKCGVTWTRDQVVEAIKDAERLGQYIDED